MHHGDIWRGIDLLAENHGLSPSGLAKLAGLDATAFNKSKRLPKDGRPRWPSTESISRVLDAVGADFDEFAGLVTGQRRAALPLLRQGDAAEREFFEPSGRPKRQGVETVEIPSADEDQGWFLFEVSSSEMDPTYQAGDRLIASRLAPLRKGNRVIIKPRQHAYLAGTLFRQSEAQIEFISLSRPGLSQIIDRADLDWIARILWVSQ